MAELTRADFDDCLNFLAGKLSAPAGAFEPETGAPPRWTSPRLWKRDGRFGLRNRRVARWFWNNVGTINSEETVRVMDRGVAVGTLEAAYAERLIRGDRFVLDGRAFEFRRLERSTLFARSSSGEPSLPRWTSIETIALVRAGRRARRLPSPGRSTPRGTRFDFTAFLARRRLRARWTRRLGLAPSSSRHRLPGARFLRRQTCSWKSRRHPRAMGRSTAFMLRCTGRPVKLWARATSARLGRQIGRDLTLCVADLGWSIRLPDDADFSASPESIQSLLTLDGLADDVLEGLDRGELLARRFRHVAATGLYGAAKPRNGASRTSRRAELGQHTALPDYQVDLPRPPSAAGDAPRSARRHPRHFIRRELARKVAVNPIP